MPGTSWLVWNFDQPTSGTMPKRIGDFHQKKTLVAGSLMNGFGKGNVLCYKKLRFGWRNHTKGWILTDFDQPSVLCERCLQKILYHNECTVMTSNLHRFGNLAAKVSLIWKPKWLTYVDLKRDASKGKRWCKIMCQGEWQDSF